MHKSALLLTVLLLGFIGSSYQGQHIPAPLKPDGITVGATKDVRFHLEAFYDLNCPDSKATHAILYDLFKEVDIFNGKGFRFTIHFFTMPFRSSFTNAQVARFVTQKLGHPAGYDYVTDFFKHNEQFSESALAGLTERDVYAQIAYNAFELVKRTIPQEDILKAIDDMYLNMDTRIGWKIAASRMVTGTPTFLANGVILDGAETFNHQQWHDFLKKYIPI